MSHSDTNLETVKSPWYFFAGVNRPKYCLLYHRSDCDHIYKSPNNTSVLKKLILNCNYSLKYYCHEYHHQNPADIKQNTYKLKSKKILSSHNMKPVIE